MKIRILTEISDTEAGCRSNIFGAIMTIGFLYGATIWYQFFQSVSLSINILDDEANENIARWS